MTAARWWSSSIIIEHLGLHHPGPVRLIPADPTAALEVRMLDRFFDNYVMTPMQKIVFDHLRPEDERDPRGVADARAMLDDRLRLAGRPAGRPHLGGRRRLHPRRLRRRAVALLRRLGASDRRRAAPRLRAYRARLLARPSFARAVDEARPYRPLFPPGAPDRD